MMDHTGFFALTNDKLTKESQIDGYRNMGIDVAALHINRRSSAMKKLDPTSPCLSPINNSASTGI